MILGGADAVCLTAGIGENCRDIISDISRSVKKISRRTRVLVVPTDEELMIGALTYAVVKNKDSRSSRKEEGSGHAPSGSVSGRDTSK